MYKCGFELVVESQVGTESPDSQFKVPLPTHPSNIIQLIQIRRDKYGVWSIVHYLHKWHVEIPLAFCGLIISMLTDSPFWVGSKSMLKDHNIPVLVSRDACHSLTIMIALPSWYHYKNPTRKYNLIDVVFWIESWLFSGALEEGED